ncbi:MAG: citrate synthase [Fibrobacterota bacterium]
MSKKFIHSLVSEVKDHNTMKPDLYNRYNVKRGLRNRDGSGVLVGITEISSVIGFEKIDEDVFPIDGDLRYRGLKIGDLVEGYRNEKRSGYEEVVFLLLVGRLPTRQELELFQEELQRRRKIPETIKEHIIKGMPGINIMNKLQTAVSALYSFDKNPDSQDVEIIFDQSLDIIAKFPALVAYSYLSAYQKKAKFVDVPGRIKGHAEAFLYMLRQGKSYTDLEKEIIDLSLTIHAEHGGGNNSSFTTHVVSSSGTDTYSTIAAAIGSLKGKYHGAANKEVMDMMEDIKKHVSEWENPAKVKQYLTQIIKKEAYDKTGLIYGLGHAVYTKSDPRAELLKEKAVEIASERNREKEMSLYLNVEKIGPVLFQKIKKSEKTISPNVDFFSGFVYDCMGIPKEIYTPIFAMSRVAGWCAHRLEEIISGKRILRPAYKYVPNLRRIKNYGKYTALAKRKK